MSMVRYDWIWLHAAGRAVCVAPSMVTRAAFRGLVCACPHPATPKIRMKPIASDRVCTASPPLLPLGHQRGQGLDDAASHELRAQALEHVDQANALGYIPMQSLGVVVGLPCRLRHAG